LDCTGLCTHSSLEEAGIYNDDLELTPEQLAAEVGSVKKKVAARIREYGLFYRQISEVKAWRKLVSNEWAKGLVRQAYLQEWRQTPTGIAHR
jgi:hypothetical protein